MEKIYDSLRNSAKRLTMPFIMALVFLSLFFAQIANAQQTVRTVPAWDGFSIVNICVGGTVTVYMDNSHNGDNYQLVSYPYTVIQTVAGNGGTISFDPLNFASTGSKSLSVQNITDGVPITFFGVLTVIDPVASTMTKSPDQAAVCAGTDVSASINVAGSGGVSCSNTYEKSINGGSWESYNPGDAISTSPSVTSVDIRAKRGGCGGSGCDEATSINYSWTVDPVSAGGSVTPSSTTVCYGINSTLLTLSGHTGSIVKWQSSVSPFSSWDDISNTLTTYTATDLTATTQYRAVVQSGVCAEANSIPATVTVNSFPTEVWVDDDYTSATPGWLCDHFATIQEGIARLELGSGGTVNVANGTYVEIGQIVISKNLSIVGADKSTTIIKPNANTGNSGDGKGLVAGQPGHHIQSQWSYT